MSLEGLTTILRRSEALGAGKAISAVTSLLSDSVSLESKANFLEALSAKGETPEELAVFARELRKLAVDPKIRPEDVGGVIVDTCGTGGDNLNLFNISTAAALVTASAGVAVAKHGNRAVTSACGSADVLEALGIQIDLPPAEAKRSLIENRFSFFFAPSYHPAFKKLAPVRKDLAQRGRRTIFNLLGPMLNPAHPTGQVVGVYSQRLLETYAQALRQLGVGRALVVNGSGMDELTTTGTNLLAELKPNGDVKMRALDISLLGLKPAGVEDLRGGSAKDNAAILETIFNGEDRGPRREVVLLNAAAAFIVAGRANSFIEGIKLAAAQIDSGAVVLLLEKLQKFSSAVKR